MSFFISEVFCRASVFHVISAFILTLAVFAPKPQTIFVLTILTKLTFVFPLFAFGTAFLLHAINGPMALLISEVFFHRSPDSPVTSAAILTVALFAPQTQPVLAGTIPTELTLAF